MLRQLVSGSLITAIVTGALITAGVLACSPWQTGEAAAGSSPSIANASRVADDDPPIAALLIASKLSSRDLAQVADFFAVDAYRIFPPLQVEVLDAPSDALNIVGETVLADGEVRHFGHTLDTGDRTQRAAFINTSDQDVTLLVLRDNAGNTDLLVPVTMKPNTMFVIGDIYNRVDHSRGDPDSPLMAFSDCVADCAEGYFACCEYGVDGLPSCSCISDSNPHVCPAGGTGSYYCSISQGTSSHSCEARCDEGYHACCNWGPGGHPTCQCKPVPVGDCDSGGEGTIRCRLTQDLPDDPGEG